MQFVYSICLAVYFWLLYLGFKMHKKLCSFVEIIIMNKTFKNQNACWSQSLFSVISQWNNRIGFLLREPGGCTRPGWPTKTHNHEIQSWDLSNQTTFSNLLLSSFGGHGHFYHAFLINKDFLLQEWWWFWFWNLFHYVWCLRIKIPSADTLLHFHVWFEQQVNLLPICMNPLHAVMHAATFNTVRYLHQQADVHV